MSETYFISSTEIAYMLECNLFTSTETFIDQYTLDRIKIIQLR